LGQVLKNAGVVQAQFFLNGLETQTSGIDFVLNQKIHSSPKHNFSINLAGNFQTSNKIVGQPKDPELIKSEGGTTLSQAIRLLLTDSRPKYKTVAGLDYRHNKLGLTMNNTLFGSTRFQDIDGGGPEMNNIQQVFSPSVVTDLNIRYNINNQINFSFSINNIFNVLPKWDLIPINSTGEQYLKTKENEELLRGLVSFGGRYSILGASGSQFSQLGTIFQSTVSIKF
jgi:iron complex outermembrane receptor protein